MRSRFTKWIAVFMVLAAASALICSVALAVPEDTKPVTLDLADADVQMAIQSLFKGTGHNYSLSADVTGTIPSLSFKDVPFNVALKNLLKAAGLVYRIQDGIYTISKKSEVAATVDTTPAAATEPAVDTTTVETTIEKVNLQNANPREILAMMKGGGNNMGSNTGMMGGYGGMGMSGMGGMGGYGGNSFGSNFGSSFGSNSYGSNSYGSSSYGSGYNSSGISARTW